MRPPDKTTPPGRAAPDAALQDSLTQHAARGPSAKGNDSTGAPKQTKPCAVCGTLFLPNRSRYRRCLPCARTLKAALVEHQKKRNRDGVIVFHLLEHLHALRSDDPAAAAWLESLRESVV